MRKIEFRGQAACNCENMDGEVIAEKGGWIYGYLCDNYIIGNIIDSCEECFTPEFWIPVDPETVGQYTGLSDINGKEIYEGDIVRHGYTCQYGDGKTNEFFNNLPVSFSNNYGGWIIGAFNILTTKNIKNYNIEVIGNIHENPELLEETK